MDSMYLPIEAFIMAWELWMDKLKFRYSWMDIQAAAS
jgi:hypothetical protein